MRRSLGRYSSLADSDHGVFSFLVRSVAQPITKTIHTQHGRSADMYPRSKWDSNPWTGVRGVEVRRRLRSCCHCDQPTQLTNFCVPTVHKGEGVLVCLFVTHKQKHLRGLSPRSNYPDRATAACRRSYCQRLRIEDVAWSAQRIPTSVFSGFKTGAATFSSK
jgi:hypothetical protein